MIKIFSNKKNNDITITQNNDLRSLSLLFLIIAMSPILIVLFIFLPIIIFMFIDILFLNLLYLWSDNEYNIILVYIASIIIFSLISNFRKNIKFFLFFFFLLYMVTYFTIIYIFELTEMIPKTDMTTLSYFSKAMVIKTQSIFIYSKTSWFFFIISLGSKNFKEYILNSSIFLIAIISFSFLKLFHVISLLLLLYLIIFFINFKVFFKNKIETFIYFLFILLALEFSTMFNLMFLSTNLFNLLDVIHNEDSFNEFLEKFKSFEFIKYILKGNLLDFSENLYRSKSYADILPKPSILHFVNIIRDKISFIFIMIIFFYKLEIKYIIKGFNLFIILSIFIFTFNFIYFTNINEINNDIFIKLIYNIFSYYIIFLMIQFKAIDINFVKKNISYIIIIFVLYGLNQHMLPVYKINFFSFIVFYFFFKMKDNINAEKNNKLFIINLLFSIFWMITLIFLVQQKSYDYSKVYELTLFLILSTSILFFTKTLKSYKESIIKKIENFLISLLLYYIIKEIKIKINYMKDDNYKYRNYKNYIRNKK